MPFGDFVNQIPPIGFLAIHIALFAIGAFFAWRSFGAGASTLGAAFSLFALAELMYMTYHLDWTTFLFAHTISEVLNLRRLRAGVRRGKPLDPEPVHGRAAA